MSPLRWTLLALVVCVIGPAFVVYCAVVVGSRGPRRYNVRQPRPWWTSTLAYTVALVLLALVAVVWLGEPVNSGQQP